MEFGERERGSCSPALLPCDEESRGAHDRRFKPPPRQACACCRISVQISALRGRIRPTSGSILVADLRGHAPGPLARPAVERPRGSRPCAQICPALSCEPLHGDLLIDLLGRPGAWPPLPLPKSLRLGSPNAGSACASEVRVATAQGSEVAFETRRLTRSQMRMRVGFGQALGGLGQNCVSAGLALRAT